MVSSDPQKRLIVVGAGGLGREIYGCAKTHPDCGVRWRPAGFLDDFPNALGGRDYPRGVIDSIRDYEPRANDVFVAGLGTPQLRRNCCEMLIRRGANFVSLIHPSAVILSNVRLGRGVVLLPNAWIGCDARVGDFVTFLPSSHAGHDTIIGDYCQCSTGCDIMGAVELGHDVLVGSGARIIPSVKVGDGAVVGAGSVVVRDVMPGQTVFAMPARPLPATE